MDVERKKARFKFSVASSVNPARSEPVLLTDELIENVRQAAEIGYPALEIHVQNPETVNVEKLKATCEKYHIKISGIATGLAYAKEGLCLIHEDEGVQKKAVERLERFVDLAAELDSSLLIGRLKGDISDMEEYDRWEKVLAANLRRAAEYAANKGVTLMLEAINRYESNYMNKVGEIAEFIRRYELPSTKVLMDVFHMNIEEASIADSIRENYDALGYFHIADSNRMYPGAGHVDLEEVLGTLESLGYEGYVSLECLRIPDGITAAREGLEYLLRHKLAR